MYHIYHIPGIKIGCSKNPKIRVSSQGYNNFDILKTIDFETIKNTDVFALYFYIDFFIYDSFIFTLYVNKNFYYNHYYENNLILN